MSMALLTKCTRNVSQAPRTECSPHFSKEEWDALRAPGMWTHDYIRSGEHWFALVQIGGGDNKAARHLKRQARRNWYKGNASDAVPVRCKRLVIVTAREEMEDAAMREKRARQKAARDAKKAAQDAKKAARASHSMGCETDSDDEDMEDDPWAWADNGYNEYDEAMYEDDEDDEEDDEEEF